MEQLQKDSSSFDCVCLLYVKCCLFWEYSSDIAAPDSLLLHLQQAISKSQQNMPRGDGGENESSKQRQWPLQTPGMINVKGSRFLICQSFRRSLTNVYLQPQHFHHSSRWSGTSEPITARLCRGWSCQSCKLGHLQPFIMHCSKEQLVFLREGWRWTM